MAIKIDSNVTGLRYAEEEALKTLPTTPTWYPLEPNRYSDFGGKLATVARNPINPSRQRKKGTVTDLEAAGGFESDLTQTNMLRLLQGFLFADARQKKTTAGLNATATALTSVVGATHTISAASGLLNFLANHLVLTSGFTTATNNGLGVVASPSTATDLVLTAGLADEAAPPAAAKVEVVGYQFESATVDVTLVGGLPRLNRASGAVDFTTLGLIPGEWICLDGDVAGNRFTNNRGFARVNAVAATYIELDKTSWTPQAEVGTGLSVRIFFGTVVKNESDPALIKRRTYQLERSLGPDPVTGTMSEYLVGACANEFNANIKEASKVTVDLSFVALDHEPRDGATGVKTGNRPTLVDEDCFNTSSDVSSIKLATVVAGNPAPAALFGYGTDLTLNVKNNVSALKAIGVLGGFETNTGTFEVGGKITAYFADTASIAALRANADVTIDWIIAKRNAGLVFDLPLLSLGDGRLAVEQDKPITLPLEMNAAESKFHHTLLVSTFPYLPTVAAP